MHTILAVDDSKTNLKVLRELLSPAYTVLLALSADIALQYLQKKQVDLILLDIVMPGMDGMTALHVIKGLPGCAALPIIFLTASKRDTHTETQCLRLGACDFITKPVVPEVLLSRISRTLELEDYRKSLSERLQEKTLEAEALALQAINTIANTLDAKDPYTKGHSVRVAAYSEALARGLGWPTTNCARLRKIALLHDVGKIGTPDSVLKKVTRLSDKEFAKIKQHCEMGAHILKDITTMPYLAMGALCHHERFDGKGYPHQLHGCEIPEEARIIGIADAYDAMTSDRCYRHHLSNEEARQEIIKNFGRQFDPAMAEVFVRLLDDGTVKPLPKNFTLE